MVKKERVRLFLHDLFLHNWGLKLISILIAFFGWFLVALYVSPNTNRNIENVPVTIDLTDTATGKLGLEVIKMSQTEVDLVIEGKRVAVGALTNENFTVTGEVSSVNTAGVYSIKLVGRAKEPSNDFRVLTVSPDKIEVRFDSVGDKKVPVAVDYSSLQTGEDLIRMTPEPELTELLIKGPESDIEKVADAYVNLTSAQPLASSKEITSPVVLRDSAGVALSTEFITLEKTELKVVVPVYKTKQVPLVVNFLNLPNDYTAADIPYTLDHAEIKLAGPPDKIDAITSLKVGDVNLNELEPGYAKDFTLSLPAGFENLENVPTVHFSFDPSGYTKKSFTVTNFVPTNVQNGKTARVLTQVLYNVTLVGPDDIMRGITDADVYGEVNLIDKKLEDGNWNYSAEIKVPGKGLVWSTGKYTVTLKIS